MHLLQNKLQFVNTIAHEGKVVVVATDTDGKIWYTIKQDGFEDSYLNTPADQRTGWEEFQELEFPNETQDDQSVIDKEAAEVTHLGDQSKFILRTRYRTQNESAAFPVQLVSATGHLYVFRQSKANSTETTPNTLLVDRFVLDGMTNQLVRKLDVRFKRSRQKYQPIASMKKNANGGLSNIDSLDFRDADGKPFYEPTTELTLIENLHQGGFSVVLLPTNEHDNYRWHIFAYNSQTQKVELTSIRASAEGLFDVKDYTVLEPRPEAKNALIPRSIPGIIKRKLDLNGVEVANGLSATKYDIQKEQQTKDGMQLLKDSTKVMVAIPTKQGNVATLSFAVAADGTLSEIDQNPDNTEILRSQSRDLLLPLNTLDEIKAIGDSTPPPQAQITGIERGYEDRVQIVSSPSSGLKTGDTVKIANTQSYNGHYQVISIDGDTFEIAAEWVNSEIGSWEVVPKTETGLVFDGMITEVERVADGKLHITAFNHGLQAGDEVQIVDTTGYDGTYGVTKIDDENFTINDLFWKPGEAVNLKLESRKRRGVMFDGADEYIKTPALELTPPSEEFSFGYTCSAWVYVSATGSGEQIIVGEEHKHIQLLVNNGTVALKVKCANGVGLTRDTTTIPTGQWVHYAGIISSDAASDKTILTLCKNGQQVGTPTEVASLFDAPENWQPEFLIGKSIAGKIADVQVWDKVRTAKEIKDSMYLQLTGREVDLVGYWRLGAITGGKERTVVDFSVYGNDGTVYGDAFVSAITLSRTLGDGTTQAVKYSNDDLVAVSARATYIETFEFKTHPSVNPNNVDGQNGKLFTFSYWGKKSRSAFERIEHKLFTIDTSDFQSLGNDWYKATCRFTVPDGVAMMRSFELGNVQGTWSTLEIRKHRVQLVSDSITEVNYTDSVSLSTLADNYAELPGQLKTLEQKEQEEAKLLKEKRELEDKIAAIDNLPRLRQEIAALETEVASLQQEKETLRNKYDQESTNPLNYWCYIENKGRGDSKRVQQVSHQDLEMHDASESIWQQWKFVSDGNGYYYIENKGRGDSKRLQQVSHQDLEMHDASESIWQQWKFVSDGNGYYYIENKGRGDSKRLQQVSHQDLEMHDASESIWQQWKLVKIEAQNTLAINTAQSLWEEKQEQLNAKTAELNEKQATLSADQSTQQAWEDRLKEVIEEFNQVQSELNTANNTVINTVSTTQQTPQTLPTLHTVSNGSQKGLVTKGALLGFASAATRIAAIETCEGNVQLSYFDNQGRMHLTNFDATSDSRNTTFEQWLPDELPVALNFADSNDKIELANPVVLGESWTVETWFSFPSAAIEKLRNYFEQKLLATDSKESDYFGYSVAISGNTAIVGAYNEDTGGQNAGAAYIFERDSSGTWTQIQKLLASDPEAFDGFGFSVAISGNIAIVGAPFKDTGGSSAGAAYIFERDSSGNWSETETKKLLASEPKASDYFGKSVGINGNIAIVGAEGDDTGGDKAGAAYIFERDSNGNWSETETQKLFASNPTKSSSFGNSVAISNNIAIVGANSEDSGGLNAGSAYIFERDNSGTWTQTKQLLASEPKASDYFGTSVSISGNIAIVGAPYEDTAGNSAGAAYIFERDSSGTWPETETQKLIGTYTSGSDKFGISVALSGNIAIVGASGEDSACIFERDSSGNWTEIERLLPGKLKVHGEFGYSVAISNNIALIGAYQAQDTGGTQVGAACIFEITETYVHGSEPARKILLGSTDDSSPVVIEEKSKLGTLVNGTFYDSGYSLERLTPGWHHLTAVGKDSTTIFYIDGRQVADVKQAYIDAATDDATKEERKTTICQATGINISTIGNSTTGSEQFGKLAEVRVWNLALSEAEIAINSKTRLSGNEPGLVAYYPLNEATGTEVRDLTGSSNTGSSNTGSSNTGSSNNSTDTDAATIEHLGHKVMEFDGQSYIDSGDILNPDSSHFTVELWFRCNSTQGDKILYNKEYLYQAAVRNGYFQYAWRPHWAWDGGQSFPVTSNVWYHAAVVYDGSNQYMYCNGEQVYSRAQTGSIGSNSEALLIGARGYNNISYHFDGEIAEVRIWNKARTAEEIQADMSQRLTGQESGLVGYWPLNQIQTEGDQQKVLDLTGNNHHGTVKGAILFDDNTLPISSNTDSANSGTVTDAISGNNGSANSSTVTDAISGNNGTVIGSIWWGCAAPLGNLGHKVMQFDGVDDYVELGDFNPGNTFTVELWVKPENTTNKIQCFLGKNTNSGGNIFLLCSQNSETLFLVLHGSSLKVPNQKTTGYWYHLAVVVKENQGNSEITIYKDNLLIHSQTFQGNTLGNPEGKPWSLGQEWDSSSKKSDFFQGQIAEVRIWNKARTAEEIQADMHQRLTGQESGLVGYWQLNHIEPEGDTIKVRDLTDNNHGTVKGAMLKDDNTLPIGSNALVSAEYSTITIDKVTNRKSAIMRRFLASPALNGVELLPEKRIETLELKWIGNAQFAPTLLGYIEGAPPIPSENLTVDIDYTSATAVELAISEDVAFSWNRSQDVGLGAYIEGFIGTAGEVSGGIGVETQLGQWKAGFKGNLDFSYQWQNQSNITSSSALSMTDRLELRGSPESKTKFTHLGQRFIPKNVGYALVVSGLADVFITRLQRSKKMIGYQVQPVDGIPPDVNTITFLINPAYTMNGSLDGMTGSSASSDRFFRHVPEMRAQYGSLYPASYYRLQEAYDLKQQIENEDKRRESYFAQFNAGLVDEASLNRNIDSGDASQDIGVPREEDKPDQELTEEEKQAAQDKQREQFEQEAGAAAEQQSEAAKQKQKEIDAKITDQETRVHATDSFAGWQKKMENIQIRAGKRNIVNTYVWDADGGMRTEAQSFANTAEHTVGGSFTLNAGLGFLGEFAAGGVAGELTAQATINMTQTMSKTEARSKGIELYVDLSGIESKGVTDENDYPLQPGEKVDRYRFMSFYLEGSTQNFNDFFTYVVDPEWLASNDEEARALRQAKGKANKTWRVLHRVTYVERPALMGFGRDIRPREDIDTITREVVNYFDLLEFKSDALQSDVERILQELRTLKQMLGEGQ
ncbi:LamG-like jellyroll fold domain-containing protein [Moorena producens]|uniref:LamG-like jellyroll fold domain-containing protein n=1 Tax=Moorena producens TaxID=1155739 RepID=UPI003C732350